MHCAWSRFTEEGRAQFFLLMPQTDPRMLKFSWLTPIHTRSLCAPFSPTKYNFWSEFIMYAKTWSKMLNFWCDGHILKDPLCPWGQIHLYLEDRPRCQHLQKNLRPGQKHKLLFNLFYAWWLQVKPLEIPYNHQIIFTGLQGQFTQFLRKTYCFPFQWLILTFFWSRKPVTSKFLEFWYQNEVLTVKNRFKSN